MFRDKYSRVQEVQHPVGLCYFLFARFLFFVVVIFSGRGLLQHQPEDSSPVFPASERLGEGHWTDYTMSCSVGFHPLTSYESPLVILYFRFVKCGRWNQVLGMNQKHGASLTPLVSAVVFFPSRKEEKTATKMERLQQAQSGEGCLSTKTKVPSLPSWKLTIGGSGRRNPGRCASMLERGCLKNRCNRAAENSSTPNTHEKGHRKAGAIGRE